MLTAGQVQRRRVGSCQPRTGRNNTRHILSVVMDSILFHQLRVSGRSLSEQLRPQRTHPSNLIVLKLLYRGHLFLPLSAVDR
jgi:hypothetical protein